MKIIHRASRAMPIRRVCATGRVPFALMPVTAAKAVMMTATPSHASQVMAGMLRLVEQSSSTFRHTPVAYVSDARGHGAPAVARSRQTRSCPKRTALPRGFVLRGFQFSGPFLKTSFAAQSACRPGGCAVKMMRFSAEQITAVLQQVAGGAPAGDVCRQVGIAEQNVLPVEEGVRRNAAAGAETEG
jgi:hypothetical protein